MQTDQRVEGMVHLNNYEGDPSDHIAIIGMTGRFPGAKNLETFWQNLHDGVESIKFFTAAELAGTNLDPALLNNPKYVGADGVIEDMDLFDAEFFGILPGEAELMDPQHRLFLECAWELMEQAGYDSESYEGRVAVYSSANLSTYLIRNIMSNPDLHERATSFQTLITNDKDFIATRVSYKMNLRGPSLSVATLCSSSFVAIHLACQALLNYQCDLAMAGAVALQASRNESFFYQEGGIGDPDGHCRAFDAKASGTVSGSGLGIVALKRLEEALKDGDFIHAVIRSTAINNDGAIKYSYTAPSAEGQSQVIAEALALAEIDPETITYVETHGTGTRLGDPIEVTALTKAFHSSGAQKQQYCAIGSVKTNIGHLVNAGGVASLIKTVLAMQHREIPPSLNFEEPNPEIDFANSPFYVANRLTPWQTQEFPLRAGVSSFGIGGTNVHMIIEEAPSLEPSTPSRPWQLLLLSAKTDTALNQATANLIEYLQQHPQVDFADVAYTLKIGRRAFNHRQMLFCRDRQDALMALSTPGSQRVSTQFQESKNRPVVFMFPGQATPLVNAGLELYQHEPTFRAQIDRCAEILQPALRIDLREALYPRADRDPQPLDQTLVADAVLFVIEYALAQLWLSWGLTPQALLGDGVGELVAACLADVLSLEAALALAVRRQADQVTSTPLSAPHIPYVSTTTGNWIKDEAADLNYWLKLPRRATHLNEGLSLLLNSAEQVLLEVGPGQILSQLGSRHPNKAPQQVILASLPEAGDAQEFILMTLGKLWLAGVQVKWSDFYAHEQRHRLPLPTYPFERQRYWIAPYQAQAPRMSEVKFDPRSLVKQTDLADWFYFPAWKRTLPVRDPANKPVQSNWLVFVDEGDLGSQLVAKLEQEGQHVVTVTAGDAFAKVNERAFILNPSRGEDYQILVNELAAQTDRPTGVVHLWNVTTTPPGMRRAQELGFYSLLFLTQSLGQSGFTDPLRVTVVSNNLQAVTADDVVYAAKAPLLGALKVISQEYPNLTCCTLDVALSTTDLRSGQRLVDQLWSDLTAPLADPVAAYRGSQRWVQTFEPVRLEASSKQTSRLRSGGAYLIIGGTAGPGLEFAEHLAHSVRAKLILTHDTNFPNHDQWALWLSAHDDSNEISRAIQKLQTMETHGELWVAKVDVANRLDLEALITQAESRWGRLDGVIYAPGNFGQASLRAIEETNQAECEQQLCTYLDGAQALAEVLAQRELDFCLLVSSLASILGGLGLVSYAAANSFLDGLARQIHQATPWISVNWDSWELDQTSRPRTALAELAITRAEGVEVLDRILGCGEVEQLVVTTANLQARLAQWVNHQSAPGDAGVNARPAARHARPNIRTPYVAPRHETELLLVNIFARMMGLDLVGVHDDFFELGGDSLLAAQIISRVREAFQLDLSLTNLFERPTIAFLAEYIETLRWAAEDTVPLTKPGNHREEIEL
ncbi:phthiocerol/phenolphthiocerol synthesis type-I polyketide synthase E [Thermoflexales bacterium]|nr:phthiocerol/phenolphthiocerol synthesis type-I polyketide synthase E [Thermoflexales bacterium]